MRNIKEDLYVLKEMAKFNFSSAPRRVHPIYKNTNENLRQILTDFNFNDKDVFSVMASGDQPLSAYYLGASSVDTFDINWPSYYFFFLKKWYVMHYKQSVFSGKKQGLAECLEEYDKTSDIECAMYEVWRSLLVDNIWGVYNLFLMDIDSFDWTVPYDADYDKFSDIVRDKRPGFQELDITKQFHSDKKYDIIILSNILETFKVTDRKNRILAHNLKNLLKDGGIVINSIVNDASGSLRKEREDFLRYFDYYITDKVEYNPNSEDEIPLYYTYTKKN